MKKLFFSVVAVAAMLVACDNKDESLKITLNPASISNISADGDEKTVTVKSPVDWTLSIPTECTWLHADVDEGKANVEATVTFTVDPNPGAERDVDVTVSGLGAKGISINVAQNAYVAPVAGDVKFSSTVNQLSTTVTFEPFVYKTTREETETPVYAHLIVYVGGDNDGDVAGEGSDDDKTAGIMVDAWGEYKFQYIAWVDLNGDEKMDEGEFEEGDQFTIKFEAPATGATLTEKVEEGAHSLVITNVQEGIQSFGLFKDGELQSGLYIPAEEGQGQVVSESGKYVVKGLYGGNYADKTAVWGNASNEVVVTIAEEA